MHRGQGVTGGEVASPPCGLPRPGDHRRRAPSGTLPARFLGLWLLRHLEQGCLCEAEKCSVWNSMLFIYWGLRE